MDKQISAEAAPGIADVRNMKREDTLWILAGAEQRKDWARYAEAIGGAVARGAEVRWVR